MKSVPAAEAFVRRQRLEHFARDAERAREEYEATKLAVDERTALLRKQRLKREAAEQKAAKKGGTKKAAAKKTVTKKSAAKKPAATPRTILRKSAGAKA
jgi:hypothetical protein